MPIFKLSPIERLAQHNFPILVPYLDRRVKSYQEITFTFLLNNYDIIISLYLDRRNCFVLYLFYLDGVLMPINEHYFS